MNHYTPCGFGDPNCAPKLRNCKRHGRMAELVATLYYSRHSDDPRREAWEAEYRKLQEEEGQS